MVDNRVAFQCLHEAAATEVDYRRRPWQVERNGDINSAVRLAVGRFGGRQSEPPASGAMRLATSCSSCGCRAPA
eukprot:967341-Alexandrium_andersonii.AAC.1